MKKILSYLLLPVIVFSSFTGTTVADNISMSISGSSTSVDGQNTLTLILNLPNDLPVDTDITITTREQNGSPLPISAGTVSVNDTNVNATSSGTGSITITTTELLSGSVTIDDLNITNPASSQNISVIVSTSTGDVGALTFPIAGANTVDITAYVGSTLSMALLGQTINLGVIPIDDIVTASSLAQTTTITVSTNAANGYTLNAQAAPLNGEPNRLLSFARVFDSLQAGQEGFAIKVNTSDATTLTGSGAIGAGTVNDSHITENALGLVHSNVPASGQQTVIDYAVSVAPTTPDGIYRETVIYSVTANF